MLSRSAWKERKLFYHHLELYISHFLFSTTKIVLICPLGVIKKWEKKCFFFRTWNWQYPIEFLFCSFEWEYYYNNAQYYANLQTLYSLAVSIFLLIHCLFCLPFRRWSRDICRIFFFTTAFDSFQIKWSKAERKRATSTVSGDEQKFCKQKYQKE